MELESNEQPFIKHPSDENISVNYQMKCPEHIRFGSKDYEYSSSTELIVLSIVLIIVGEFFGILNDLLNINPTGNNPLDLWSICHIMVSAGVFSLILLLSKRIDISLILSFIITFSWEGIEYLMAINNILYSFAYEGFSNKMFDLICDTIGILSVYLYFANKKRC